MKICPKCNTGNSDNAFQCRDCGFSLSREIVNSRDYVGEISAREEKQHKFRMLLHIILLPVLGALYVFLYVKALSRGEILETTFVAVLLPLIAYVNIHHPKEVFMLTHILTINNVDDVELSDWYMAGTKISGYLCLVMGFVFIGMFAFA